jgi:hypothetical protein
VDEAKCAAGLRADVALLIESQADDDPVCLLALRIANDRGNVCRSRPMAKYIQGACDDARGIAHGQADASLTRVDGKDACHQGRAPEPWKESSVAIGDVVEV